MVSKSNMKLLLVILAIIAVYVLVKEGVLFGFVAVNSLTLFTIIVIIALLGWYFKYR